MANLTVTVAVSTGTQYITGSTSNIFTFDGSQPASFTFPWVEDGTVRLEQSGSSNDGHPLIFSTSNSSTLGTMRAGIISSGVTYYLDGASNQSDYTNTTTFNAATTRYIEIAPASQTDFYFACWVHGIGMGGIMDITQDTWGALSWSDHDWGDQATTTVVLSGLSITSTLNSDGVVAFNEQGWGSDAWGDENWGESAITISPTGYSITASLGTLDYAGATDGWGRDAWGDGDWGQNVTTVPVTGLEITASLGLEGWGRSTWGNDAWGEQSTVNIEIGEPLTGFSITGSLGTPQINYDFKVTLTESLLGTLSLGSLTTIPDMVIGVSGYGITASLGNITEEVITSPTGYQATMSLGTIGITSNPLVPVTGYSITGSLGSLGAIDDMSIGVSGYSITGSLGTTTVTDMAIGVSGLEISGTLGSGGVAPLGYKDVDITGNTSYTYVEHSA